MFLQCNTMTLCGKQAGHKQHYTYKYSISHLIQNVMQLMQRQGRVLLMGFVSLLVITKWKSYFPVQHWCQSGCSCNLLLLQPRDGGSMWRFNSPPEPQLNSAAIKKKITFWLQQILAEVLHGSGTVRTDIPPVERRLKEHRGQTELRAKQEVRTDRDH